VLGAFSELDHFVTLHFNFRNQLNWDEDIEHCIKKWHALFPKYQRLSGAFPNDYISENWIIV